jgi:hypothetical protein
MLCIVCLCWSRCLLLVAEYEQLQQQACDSSAQHWPPRAVAQEALAKPLTCCTLTCLALPGRCAPGRVAAQHLQTLDTEAVD